MRKEIVERSGVYVCQIKKVWNFKLPHSNTISSFCYETGSRSIYADSYSFKDSEIIMIASKH